MAGPGEEIAAGRGHLRASRADREQVIGTLKAAFVQGRLTKAELDARVGHALTSRTYADLAALTADIPAGLTAAEPKRKPVPGQPRAPATTPVKAGVRAIIAAIMMEVAGYAAGGALALVTVVIFVASFIAWAWVLSAQPDKRSRRQPPPRPAQPGRALDGEQDGGIGDDLVRCETRRVSGRTARASSRCPGTPRRRSASGGWSCG